MDHGEDKHPWPWSPALGTRVHIALGFGDLQGWTPGKVGTLWKSGTPATCGGQTHIIGPTDTQKRSGSLKDLPVVGRVSERHGSDGALSTGERPGA